MQSDKESVSVSVNRNNHRGKRKREAEISMRTSLAVLISFDPIVTTSIMQTADESMIASVNRNGRGAVFKRGRDRDKHWFLQKQ